MLKNYNKISFLNKKRENKLLINNENNININNMFFSFSNCYCKNSFCLKGYCECFNKFNFCNKFCNCVNCLNKEKNLKERNEAIIKLNFKNLKKEKFLFCLCKKNKCLKKYCECFNNGNKCNENCKCFDCKNKNEKLLFKINDDKKFKFYNKNYNYKLLNNINNFCINNNNNINNYKTKILILENSKIIIDNYNLNNFHFK